jgi:hypothetical protein
MMNDPFKRYLNNLTCSHHFDSTQAKSDLVGFAAIVLLTLCGATSAEVTSNSTLQENGDGTRRVPFQESFECLNASNIPEQWNISDHDFELGITKELDDFLKDSFTSHSYIRTEGLTISLKESLVKDDAGRSFLRQKDYKSSSCDYDLDLTGIAIFTNDFKDKMVLKDVVEHRRLPFVSQRFMIYSRVAQTLAAEQRRVKVTVQAVVSRRLQSCTNSVSAFYTFASNEYLCSSSDTFFFGLGDDGDLAIWKGSTKVWLAGTSGTDSRLVLQPDGNLVVRNRNGAALWSSGTAGAVDSGGEVSIADNGTLSIINAGAGKTKTLVPDNDNIEACQTKLEPTARLNRGERICSQDGKYSFGLTSKGILGVFFGPQQIWSVEMGNGGCAYGHLQEDGNFVLRSMSGGVIWESGTGGPVVSNAIVTINNDGIVTFENQSADKVVIVDPFDTDDNVVEDEKETDDPMDPVEDSCIEQVSGRIDLYAGDFICSPSGRYRFGITLAGDLTLFDGSTLIWSAGTCCSGDGVFVVLQESDGNLVVQNSDSKPLWVSATADDANAKSSLSLYDSGTVSIANLSGQRTWGVAPRSSCLGKEGNGFVLLEGEFICSSNERFRFGVVDGDLSLWDDTSLLWSSGLSYRSSGVYMYMQGDGNLVVRDETGDALWRSRTAGYIGSSLSLDDNGTAVIRSPDGTLLWSATGSIAQPSHPTLSPIPPTPMPTPLPPSPTTEPPFNKAPSLDPWLVPCLDPVQGRVIMNEGDFFCSPNGVFRFGMALDGDLALFEGSHKMWSANTCCMGKDSRARLQSDGNLLVETPDLSEVFWTSGSANDNTEIASLIVRDDGVVSINDSKLGNLWSTGPIPTRTPTPPMSSPTTPPFSRAPPLDPSLITCRDSVRGPVTLKEGDFFCSQNGRYKFGLAPGGELSLYEGSQRVWNADTCCTGEEVIARLQADGNLVVSTLLSDRDIWTSSSATQGLRDASLVVGEGGIVTVTDSIVGHVWSTAIASDQDRVETDSLVGKVMAGYQGWFFAKGDGGRDRWIHWSRPNEIPSRNSVTIDAWPDLRELDDDELYPTQFSYQDGSNAGLYSAYNTKTVERHTKWMQDYGVHGVFVQRFVGNARASHWLPVIDKVLASVRSGAEKHGRTFVNMYDIGNGNEATIVQDIINDWKHLVDDEHITKSKSYLYHRGRPLVAMWGWGFDDRLGSPRQAAEIIDWFHNKAEEKYKATVMGGVPTGWRDLSRDSKGAGAWASVYRSFDVISPWAVGRLVDIRTANFHRVRYTEPDLTECNALGIDYLPVVFPGFSFSNYKPTKPFNEIPRNGGTFMWRQMYNAVAAGSKMIYVAMFDEVDEGTAIFKIAKNQQQTPREGRFLSADIDQGYRSCPGDWYLNITGAVAGLVQDGRDVPVNMPAYP